MGFALTTPARAQNAPICQYCLLDGSHPDTSGMVLCRYETLARCMAGRNSFNDTCYVNPQYGGRRRWAGSAARRARLQGTDAFGERQGPLGGRGADFGADREMAR